MHGKKVKTSLLYIATVIVSVALLMIGNSIASSNLFIFQGSSDQQILEAYVHKITSRDIEEYTMQDGTEVKSTEIYFEAEILEGEFKGERVSAFQRIDTTIAYKSAVEVSPGDDVMLLFDENEPNLWQYIEYIRTDKLLIFGLIFIICLIIFGKSKGVSTVISLTLTCAAIFAVFIPAILSGKNIYVWSILICVYTISMTFLIVNGFKKKTLAAIIGAFSGILVVGLMTIVMSNVLKLTGIVDDESVYLTYLPLANPISLKAIIFAAIVIGSLGAVMDISISIASSLWEVNISGEAELRSLYQSGINIGKDMMGTMANTLILAYIGGSLAMVLLFAAYNPSLKYLLNREMIIVEILQAIIGSFGLLSALPLTSLICGILYTKGKSSKDSLTF